MSGEGTKRTAPREIKDYAKMRAWILRQHPEIATNQRGDRKMRELKSVALVAFTFGCAPVLAACAPSSPSTAAQSAFDQYVGKTCTGIIHHNELDETGYMGRPGLSPFEIPVVAKFFRTSDGRPGISFKYANRAPVIYIVSSLRDDGLNFAGQLGSQWKFNYESPNHLSVRDIYHVSGGESGNGYPTTSPVGEFSCTDSHRPLGLGPPHLLHQNSPTQS